MKLKQTAPAVSLFENPRSWRGPPLLSVSFGDAS
jgi:hypothetical protein